MSEQMPIHPDPAAIRFGPRIYCADCGQPVGNDRGPKDGWHLEDGRTVCHSCCVADAVQLFNSGGER